VIEVDFDVRVDATTLDGAGGVGCV
jgi:hypothetical protein